MVAGLSFPFYSEARITFPPTYKFDLGTDNYDTSYVLLYTEYTIEYANHFTVRKLAFLRGPIVFSGRALTSGSYCTTRRLSDFLIIGRFMQPSSAG